MSSTYTNKIQIKQEINEDSEYKHGSTLHITSKLVQIATTEKQLVEQESFDKKPPVENVSNMNMKLKIAQNEAASTSRSQENYQKNIFRRGTRKQMMARIIKNTSLMSNKQLQKVLLQARKCRQKCKNLPLPSQSNQNENRQTQLELSPKYQDQDNLLAQYHPEPYPPLDPHLNQPHYRSQPQYRQMPLPPSLPQPLYPPPPYSLLQCQYFQIPPPPSLQYAQVAPAPSIPQPQYPSYLLPSHNFPTFLPCHPFPNPNIPRFLPHPHSPWP